MSGAAADSTEPRLITEGDFDAALGLALSLPEWFNPEGIEQIQRDLPVHDGAVIELGGVVAGFVTWTLDEQGSGEITWIAVAPGHHRTGLGRRMLEMAEDRLRDQGAADVFVETLGDSVEYEPYERTRSFYRAMGFADFKRVMTDNPGMPESLTLRKSLKGGATPGG